MTPALRSGASGPPDSLEKKSISHFPAVFRRYEHRGNGGRRLRVSAESMATMALALPRLCGDQSAIQFLTATGRSTARWAENMIMPAALASLAARFRIGV